MKDWYKHRDELREGMVFRMHDGLVKLDRRVPGGGTKWYVADWSEHTKSFLYEDSTIEPGDLIEKTVQPRQPIPA